MTPRPIHRWKTFWLGIFILTFLGWAWLVSMDSYRAAQVETSRGWIAIAQMEGKAGIFTDSSYTSGWQITTAHWKGTGGSREYQTFWQGSASAHGRIVTSHASLILLFLIPWLAFLAWRWRRMKRLTNPPAQLEPTP